MSYSVLQCLPVTSTIITTVITLSARVKVNGASPEGSNNLFLAAFEPPTGVLVFGSMPINSGQSTPVPVFAGRHFYSMVVSTPGSPHPSVAVVTGVLDTSNATANSTMEIDWRGQALSVAEWSALGKNGFLVTRCGDRDLQPIKDVWCSR